MAKIDLASVLQKSVKPVPLSDSEEEKVAEATPPNTEKPTADTAAQTDTAETPALTATPAVVTDPTPTETPAAESEATPKAKPRARKPAAKRTPAAQSSAPADGTEEERTSEAFAIELPVELDARLTSYRAQTRRSHHATLLDAIDATYEQLPDLVAKALGLEEAAQPKKSLFSRSPRVFAPVPPPAPGEKVTHRFRVTPTNRQIITDLAEQCGAPSRNFLVVTAYDAFLPPLD